MADSKRGFSEREASLILKRASELAVNEPADSRRMSLAELEQVADEAGIDRALVRRAAGELVHTPTATPPDNVMLGGPTLLVFEATVEGELAESSHEHVVMLARRLTGEQGRHDVIGSTLTWSTARSTNQLHRNIMVTVSARNGFTTIRVEERLGQLAGALFGGIGGGVGGGGLGLWIGPLIVAGIPWLLPVAFVVWLGGVWTIARKVYASKVRTRSEELRQLLKAIVELTEDTIGQSAKALPPQP